LLSIALLALLGRVNEAIGVGGGVAGTAERAATGAAVGATAATANGRAVFGPQGAQLGHQPRPLKVSMLLLTCWITLLAAPPDGGTKPEGRTDTAGALLPRGCRPCRPCSLLTSVGGARLDPNHQLPLPPPSWPLPMLLLALLDLLTDPLTLLLLAALLMPGAV
jgi:hypothetical protein